LREVAVARDFDEVPVLVMRDDARRHVAARERHLHELAVAARIDQDDLVVRVADAAGVAAEQDRRAARFELVARRRHRIEHERDLRAAPDGGTQCVADGGVREREIREKDLVVGAERRDPREQLVLRARLARCRRWNIRARAEHVLRLRRQRLAAVGGLDRLRVRVLAAQWVREQHVVLVVAKRDRDFVGFALGQPAFVVDHVRGTTSGKRESKEQGAHSKSFAAA
jgi:hypothetical protein